MRKWGKGIKVVARLWILVILLLPLIHIIFNKLEVERVRSTTTPSSIMPVTTRHQLTHSTNIQQETRLATPEPSIIDPTSPKEKTPRDVCDNTSYVVGISKSPTVEPLTPLISPKVLGETDYTAVRSYLRLPVLLTKLSDVLPELLTGDALHLFLETRSVLQQLQFRDLLGRLHRQCNDLCHDIEGIQDTLEVSPVLGSNDTGDLSLSIKLEASAGSYDGEDADSKECPESPVFSPTPSNFEPASDNIDLFGGLSDVEEKATFIKRDKEQKMDCIEPRALFIETNDLGEGTDRSGQDSSEESSPVCRDVKPTRTIRKTSSSQASPCESDLPIYHSLISQSLAEFVQESLHQVECFQIFSEPDQTYHNLFASLKARKQEVGWSDGSQWKALVDSGHQDRKRSTIRYALTAIAFCRWHRSQVDLLPHSSTRTAAQSVVLRVVGEAPEDESNRKAWEKRRKTLNTHLTRGRKWNSLVYEFGFGFLFKDAWALAKSSESSLVELVSQLHGDTEKRAVLALLSEQMDMLLENGRTDAAVFRCALKKQDLLHTLPVLPDSLMPVVSQEIASLQDEMKQAVPVGKLLVKGTGYQFPVDILDRIDGTQWFNDTLILLCLHLADRLSYVRVGFSIPIHQQTGKGKILPRPFQKAMLQIKQWNSTEHDPSGSLVCFFPLWQHGNHFSLLEINQKEDVIYHYDPEGTSVDEDIKTACKKEFPEMKYIERVRFLTIWRVDLC